MGEGGGNLGDFSLLDLFRVEVEQQANVLTDGLLALEQDPTSAERLEPLMRAAHSIKGAARLVDVQAAVELAHRMEDCFVAAQKGEIVLSADHIDVLLKGIDMISTITMQEEGVEAWLDRHREEYHALLCGLEAILQGEAVHSGAGHAEQTGAQAAPTSGQHKASGVTDGADIKSEQVKTSPSKRSQSPLLSGRVLRVSADQLNRLMGLAGESLVESRWLRPYAESMLRLKRRQVELITHLDSLRGSLEGYRLGDILEGQLRELQTLAADCRQILADRLAELEGFDRRSVNLASRLHREVVVSRMRPFEDGVKGFPRMVRDVARSLNKDVELEIEGLGTMVDREILDKIEAPLNHILRNAVDHGIESPQERKAQGKPERGKIHLAAYHQAGMLSVVVQDDGRGVDVEKLRDKVQARSLVDADMAVQLSEAELMEFLFLPSFTTKDEVTEISGRGVGMDVVHDVVQEMRGTVRATSKFGKGMRIQLQLPLTLSVIPSLLIEVGAEPYGLPLARIERILQVERSTIEVVEGHQFIDIEGQTVGLVSCAQILDVKNNDNEADTLSVVVIGERKNRYGLAVEGLLGERDLVVQQLPAQLGRIKDISAAALMEDGAPLLIIDVDDMLRSIQKVVVAGRLNRIGAGNDNGDASSNRRILVVDDSITVREVERKLLEAVGYHVEVAVDGMDGWHMLQNAEYDLVITDVDMPRMDGFELVRLIKQDSILQRMPVMIVSYKDREEDRLQGLEAGADYYLTKGSFHDETLREAVADLLGEGQE